MNFFVKYVMIEETNGERLLSEDGKKEYFMYNIRKITEDVVWIGGNDRRLALFENVFPIPEGVSYNSYLLTDKKTVLLDTADAAIAGQFFENLVKALDGRPLDYIVVNHMEPDHCALLEDVLRRYPDATIVGNVKTFTMINGFFGLENARRMTVKEGDSLDCGKHKLFFYFAPMVHWPEVMVTYDAKDKILFSADAFGSFKSLDGNLFNDEVNFERDWLDEARRYYTNIVGKYGVMVQGALKKLSALDISYICPLHGLVWRNDFSFLLEKYDKWSRYEAESDGIVIIYASIYGHTENAAEILASMLSKKGVRGVRVYDASRTHVSELISEIFRVKNVVLASSTYNAEIYTPMKNLIADMKALAVQNKNFAVIENGSWAPSAKAQMTEQLSALKGCTFEEVSLTIRSSLKEEQLSALETLAGSLAGKTGVSL